MLEKDCNGNPMSTFPPCYAFQMNFTALAPRLIRSISRNIHYKNRALKRLWPLNWENLIKEESGSSYGSTFLTSKTFLSVAVVLQFSIHATNTTIGWPLHSQVTPLCHLWVQGSPYMSTGVALYECRGGVLIFWHLFWCRCKTIFFLCFLC